MCGVVGGHSHTAGLDMTETVELLAKAVNAAEGPNVAECGILADAIQEGGDEQTAHLWRLVGRMVELRNELLRMDDEPDDCRATDAGRFILIEYGRYAQAVRKTDGLIYRCCTGERRHGEASRCEGSLAVRVRRMERRVERRREAWKREMAEEYVVLMGNPLVEEPRGVIHYRQIG